jgi:hypothetical protein
LTVLLDLLSSSRRRRENPQLMRVTVRETRRLTINRGDRRRFTSFFSRLLSLSLSHTHTWLYSQMVSNITAEIFDSSSAALPSLSSIYGDTCSLLRALSHRLSEDYMKRMLSDPKKPTEGTAAIEDATTATPAASTTPAPVSQNKPTGLLNLFDPLPLRN